MEKAILLFCDDFRIRDNPTLHYAVSKNIEVLFLYIYDENYQGRKLGAASKVFLHHTLKSFSDLLKKTYNANLIIKCGDTFTELEKIYATENISEVIFTRSYSKKQIEAEAKIVKHFNGKSFKGKVIFEPEKIGEAKVFTHFWRKCLSPEYEKFIGIELQNVHNAVKSFQINSLKIEDLNLLPKSEGKWHENLIKNWVFDYEKIEAMVADFVKNKISHYAENRNVLSENAISKFSPYIKFGMISVRSLLLKSRNYQTFASEIGWREFAHNAFFYNPKLHLVPIKNKFEKFGWENNEDFLQKWQKGETGEWLIDAGMQELWQTGYMHNRARMNCASFLIKDLLLDWKLGENWFWDCLVDACPAINAFSWQWVFGSGYDAAPYFRIFNPKLQAEKFDPEAKYRKQFKPRQEFEILVNHDIQRKIVLEKYKEIN